MTTKKQKNNETLQLTLKKVWYEMIESGVKTEEYRELKDYWCRRIKGLGLICPYAMPSHETGKKTCQKTGAECVSGVEVKQRAVVFRKGYGKETMKFNIAALSVRNGKTEWGAPENKMVISIGLGERADE